jgi:hypothetical protein
VDVHQRWMRRLAKCGGFKSERFQSKQRQADSTAVRDLLIFFAKFLCCLHPGLNVKFFVNVLDMHFNGVVGYAKAVADFFVKAAVGQQFQNFLLALGELFHVGRRLPDFVSW